MCKTETYEKSVPSCVSTSRIDVSVSLHSTADGGAWEFSQSVGNTYVDPPLRARI